MAPAQTNVRSMCRWWLRDPYFVHYMMREGTSVFVAIYAVILLVGLFRLTQGEAAYNAWREALASPASIVFHWILLLTVGYHAYTWWKVAPKTAPDIRIRGRALPPMVITAGGWLATIGTSVLIYIIVRWM